MGEHKGNENNVQRNEGLEEKKDNPDKLLAESVDEFPRLRPSAESEGGDRITRAGVTAVAAGVGTNALYSEVTQQAVTGLQDEVTALSAAAAGAFFASIKSARWLCSTTTQEQSQQFRINQLLGASGGLTTGITAANFLTAAVVPLTLLDGGIVLGTTLAGYGIVRGIQSWRRKKKCDYCQEWGHCTQRVCRNCYRIFFPATEPIDCTNKPFLNWYSIASQLQKLGEDTEFNYLDATLVFMDNYQKWGIRTPRDKGFVVDCRRFLGWLREGGEVAILEYAGLGRRINTRLLHPYPDLADTEPNILEKENSREMLDEYLTRQEL